MSAHDQMRAMLDQLMGTGRDGEDSKNRVRFDDPKVCKSFLMGCCPHEILSSTRMDLGECHRMHDLALKADFEMASKDKDYYYDIDAMEHLTTFVDDCNRRTEMAKRRLKETQEELSEESNTKAEEIHQLGEQIGTKLARAEELGADGNVEESLKLMQEIEELKKEKTVIEQDYRNSMPASSYQQQKLRVCEICSAYLGIHDNDRRLADHFGGKLHLGFITIREKLEDLQKSVKDRREQREQAREERRRKEQEESDKRRAEVEERRKRREESRERERERRRRGSRSRDRRRRRSRSRQRRSRSRSKSRRSRSRSRHRRSRSRSRHRRRRSRSRSRDRRSRGHRSRHSRSRSRSRRSRSQRSRSRGHRRSRSRSRKYSRSRSKSRSPRSRSRNKSENRSNTSPKQHEGASSATANGETTKSMSATSNAEAPEEAADVNDVAYM